MLHLVDLDQQAGVPVEKEVLLAAAVAPNKQLKGEPGNAR
jgi:hypothetical protein